jgi:gluconolactonase
MKASYKLLLVAVVLAGTIHAKCTGQTENNTTGSVIRLEPELDRIIPPGALPEILAEGFDWSEGPLWLPDQEALIFSDIPQNSIFRWDERNGLQLYLKPSGYTDTVPRGGETGSNGLLLDREGRLVLCQHGDRRMAMMKSPPDHPSPDFVTLADRWDGKRFNSPNDAVFRKDGILYFTDPAYGMEFGYRDSRREMDFTGVFMLRTSGEVSLVTDAFSAPNGIGLSPGETRMYVANSGGKTGLVWMLFDIAEDGMPMNPRIFCDARPAADSLRGGPDGLVVRSDGIIFAAGPGGVWIIRPDGTHLGIIRTGQATSNCTLDAEEKYLYMTCDMYLMRIRLL